MYHVAGVENKYYSLQRIGKLFKIINFNYKDEKAAMFTFILQRTSD
jgi:hypothetical protein